MRIVAVLIALAVLGCQSAAPKQTKVDTVVCRGSECAESLEQWMRTPRREVMSIAYVPRENQGIGDARVLIVYREEENKGD